jgi:phosphotransacetylase
MNIDQMAHDYLLTMLSRINPINELGAKTYLVDMAYELAELMQKKKFQYGIPEAIRDKPEECAHLSTTLIVGGKAECFMCGATVNTKREVIDHG